MPGGSKSSPAGASPGSHPRGGPGSLEGGLHAVGGPVHRPAPRQALRAVEGHAQRSRVRVVFPGHAVRPALGPDGEEGLLEAILAVGLAVQADSRRAERSENRG